MLSQKHSDHSWRSFLSTCPTGVVSWRIRRDASHRRPASSPMDERLRRACPCLEKLWQRIFGDKKSSPAAGAAGRTGADNAAYNDDVEAQSPVLTPPQAEEKLSESGAIYTAVWSFEARHQDELSFQEGDIFSVFDRNGDWCTAQKIDNNGRVLDTGIVPIYYLSKAESLRTQP